MNESEPKPPDALLQTLRDRLAFSFDSVLTSIGRFVQRLPGRIARSWRRVRAPALVAIGLAFGFGVPYGLHLDALVRERFADFRVLQPSRVYARPLRLAPNLRLTPDALEIELAAARYAKVDAATLPGTYRREKTTFEVATRAFRSAQGAVPERRLRVTLVDGRVTKLLDADTGKPIAEAWIDPARIATLYGKAQEERRFVRATDVPPLLVAALQAVEDRDFKHHFGLDPWAILRAAWVNLRHGEVVQGGSTLTQQLVRNVFLERTQRWTRKLNEAALALLIEARYSKQRILEAYLNEVYLGQQGAQAIHGVAAGAEFYFGRDLSALSMQDIALLVGLIQGPSLHDPRRYPERARARRNVVLKVMEDTGLISAIDRQAAQRAPLGVSTKLALPKNRYPAFVDLAREQVLRDFPDAMLRSEGLSILTTLAPSTQAFAEDAITTKLAALGKNAAKLQAAVVVTAARTGAIEAVVGGRDPDDPGFNRAVRAARPIGSLVKPFVYLVALAQPESWSLMSLLSDRALTVRQPNGKTWSPANYDNTEHGDVALVDALARSYNLATVRLGLELDVAKVERVLEALIPGADVTPHPALLLGATELSPVQVAQAYQYLASDGRPLPLFAVEAVLDARGQPLTRYTSPLSAGELVSAARLVSFALQEATRSGTAHALVGLGLGHLHPAGKTGTSNDLRDSWFAGHTSSHLAVVWVGTDDNQVTGLSGATGALRVWGALFEKLPTEPLSLALGEDPQLAWVDPSAQRLTDEGCPGARRLPFIRGYEPYGYEGCGWGDLFDGGGWNARDDERETGRDRQAWRDPERARDGSWRYDGARRGRDSWRDAEDREDDRYERRREQRRRWFNRDDDEDDVM
jgi:penicillin-binding protein 1B